MSYYADETYAVYNERVRTARKDHRCDACGRRIEPGHKYCYVSFVWDGTADSVKRCGACQKTHVHLRYLGAHDEMWPDERLGCGKEYCAEWGAEPPPEIQRLPFLSDDEASALLRK